MTLACSPGDHDICARYDCGCVIRENMQLGEVNLERCTLHENAPAMLRGLEAAIAALDSAADYVTSSSAHAAIWALCNGYEGSPDIEEIVRRAKGEGVGR